MQAASKVASESAKRCSKLPMTQSPFLHYQLRSRLSDAWNNGLSFGNMTHLAVAVDAPSNASGMRHDYHNDVFPERGTGAAVPTATMAIYLTAPPEDHPIENSGATIFPEAGLKLRPRVGRLLAWANTCDDGKPAPNGIADDCAPAKRPASAHRSSALHATSHLPSLHIGVCAADAVRGRARSFDQL